MSASLRTEDFHDFVENKWSDYCDFPRTADLGMG